MNTFAQHRDKQMRAIVGLIELGASSDEVVEVAMQLSTLRSDLVQIGAANLLWSATEDAELVIGVLERQFDGGDLLRAADLARRMGASAEPLRARFEELLAQEEPLGAWGIVGEMPFANEGTRRALRAATDSMADASA